MKKFIFLLLMVIFLISPIVGHAAEIKLGLLPRLPEREMVEMFTPFARYLERETGIKVTLVVPKDFDTFTKMAIAGEFDLAYANPLIYVQVKKATPEIEPLSMTSEPGEGTALKGVIIARADSPISSVKDLRGKKISFVDRGSAAGYIAQMLELQKAGIKKHEITITFAGRPAGVAEAVREGLADAGGMPLRPFERLPYKHLLKVIGTTTDLPNWPLFTTKKTDKAVAEKIKAATLKLSPGLRSLPIVGAARIEGFVPTTDKDFDIMREAARAAGAF